MTPIFPSRRDMSALMSSAAPLPMQMYSWLMPKYFAASRLLTLIPDGYSLTRRSKFALSSDIRRLLGK